ncbi:MAG: tetratricopeptide repeat protein [Candidatus Methylomirabilales bacterium]
MRRPIAVLGALSLLVLTAADLGAAPNEAAQRNNLGASLLEQGKVDEAVAEFQKAVELEPANTVAHLNLAYAYDRQGRIEEAVSQYQKVIDLEPGNFFAHNNLGALYDKQGLYEDAIREFEWALEIDPSNATAVENLENAKGNRATVREREERFAQALEKVEADPTDPRASYELGRLYASFGEKKQALEWLAKALDLGFDDLRFMAEDPALVGLRDDPNFSRLLEPR